MKRLLTAFAFLLLTSAAFSQEGARQADPPHAVAVYCATVRFECLNSDNKTPDVTIRGIPGGCSNLDTKAEEELMRLYPDFCGNGEVPVMVYVFGCHRCIPEPVPDELSIAARADEPCKVCGMTCYYTFANGKRRGFSAFGPCALRIIQRKACCFAREDCTTIASCDKCKCDKVDPNSNCIAHCGRCR